MSLLSRLKKTPRLYNFLRDFKRISREALRPTFAPKFRGWYGMTLHTDPPWKDSHLRVGSVEHKFSLVDESLKKSVIDGSFRLIQFERYGLDIKSLLDELTWRHFVVYWSSSYAAKNTKSGKKSLVEVGVADGLTLYYALNAMTDNGETVEAYLYDTWGKVELVNPSTIGNTNQYDYLEVESTAKNLSKYGKDLVFKQGFIPETFTGEEEPESIVWLHIDLNSSPPTLDTLDYYWDRLEAGGVVLFDDYAQPTYIDTKQVVDKWILGRTDGIILQMPTSQALIFKI